MSKHGNQYQFGEMINNLRLSLRMPMFLVSIPKGEGTLASASKQKKFLLVLWCIALFSAIYLLVNVDRFLNKPREPIASFTSVQGDVEVRHEDDVIWSPVAGGDNIGDRFLVATGDNSSAKITFNGGRSIKLGENSQIYLTNKIENQLPINQVSLVRGEVVALKVSRIPSGISSPNKPLTLVIKAKNDQSIRLIENHRELEIKKDVEANLVEVREVSGKSKKSEGPPKHDKDGKSGPTPVLMPKFAAETAHVLNPMEISNNMFLHIGDHTSKPLEIAIPRKAVANPVKLAPRKSVVKLPSTSLVTLSPALPPALPTPSFPVPSVSQVKQTFKEVHPPPITVADRGKVFCTFREFQEGSPIDSIRLPLKWTPNPLAPPLSKPFYAMELSGESSVEDDSRGLKIGPLRAGTNDVEINIEEMLFNRSELNNGITVVPVNIRTWIRESEDDDEKISAIHQKLVKFCSFSSLKEHSYRIELNEISERNARQGDWFEWRRPEIATKYEINLLSKGVLDRFQNVLKSAREFKIGLGGFETLKKSIFFVKYGRVLASIEGATPSRSEIKLMRTLVNADFVFIAEGGTYVPLEDSIATKMTAIDKILRSRDKIFIFSHGRLVSIEKKLVRDNAALVRSYMQGTWGFFLAPPEML